MMRTLRAWFDDIYRRRYELAERGHVWWARYSGSIAFLAVIAITILASLKSEENDRRHDVQLARIQQTETELHAEREERIAQDIRESEARINALLVQQAALAKHEIEVAKQLQEQQLRLARQANFEGCQRDNQLRRRLRASVAAQIELTKSLGISALSRLSTVREYVEVMNRQEMALVRLHNELDQTDCEAAYPPVAQ